MEYIERRKAEQSVQRAIKHILPEISNRLDNLHGTSNGIGYWAILINMSLTVVIETYYVYKFNARECEWTGSRRIRRPLNTRDLIEYIGDAKQMWIFHDGCWSTNVEDNKSSIGKEFISFLKTGFLPGVKECLRVALVSIFSPKKLLLLSFFLGKNSGISFFSQPIFKFRKIYSDDIGSNFENLEDARGKPLAAFLKGGGIGFIDPADEPVLTELCWNLLPKTFLMHFKYISWLMHSLAPLTKSRTLIVGDSVLGGNDSLKFVIAAMVQNGAELWTLQHGGYYGYSKYFTSMANTEYLNSDRFISWGWTNHADYLVNTLPCSSITLSMLRQMKSNVQPVSKTRGVLIGNSYPKFFDRISSIPLGHEVEKYYQDTCEFIRHIIEWRGDVLEFRPYFGSAEEIRANYRDLPPVEIKYRKGNASRPWQFDYRIVVLDHLGTGFLESIALNIPTMAFVDLRSFPIDKSSESIFEELQRVGILHLSPRHASAHYMSIFDNVDAWWHSSAVQYVVEQFSRQYARSSECWLEEWATLLRSHSSFER